MARAKSTGNGNGLEEATRDLTRAQASLVQAHASLAKAQADFLAQSAETNARWASINARWAEDARRMVVIEADIAETKQRTDQRIGRIEAILVEHGRMLQALSDLVRERIGFKPPNT